jgi:hypothetical protein
MVVNILTYVNYKYIIATFVALLLGEYDGGG